MVRGIRDVVYESAARYLVTDLIAAGRPRGSPLRKNFRSHRRRALLVRRLKAFSSRRRCPSAHTGADEVSSPPRRERSPDRSASRHVILSERSESKDPAPGARPVSPGTANHSTRRRRDPSLTLRMTRWDRLHKNLRLPLGQPVVASPPSSPCRLARLYKRFLMQKRNAKNSHSVFLIFTADS